MKRGLSPLVLLSFALLFALALGSADVSAQAADCRFMTVCPVGWAAIGWVTDDGHFSNDSSLPTRICCDGLDPGNGIASLNYSNDGHVSFGTTVTNFPNGLRLGFTRQTCSLKMGNCANGLGEACIFRVTSDATGTRIDNSHVAECGSGDLNRNFCCRRTELCYNGVDDDEDGYIDCADEDCKQTGGAQPMECTGSPLTSDVCVQLPAGLPRTPVSGIYNSSCEGQTPLGNPALPNYYYCSYSDIMPGTGICCQSGTKARYNMISGAWACVSSEKCGLDPALDCHKDFDTEFNPWISMPYSGGAGTWCNSRLPTLYTADPPISERSTACCLTVEDGTVGYYTDNDNVIIFGTTP